MGLSSESRRNPANFWGSSNFHYDSSQHFRNTRDADGNKLYPHGETVLFFGSTAVPPMSRPEEHGRTVAMGIGSSPRAGRTSMSVLRWVSSDVRECSPRPTADVRWYGGIEITT
ncbi:hypothetical protein ASPZODRAFT_14193 [Penicilliopsis zonata CBS 506.65]|uniref:Uncharacterized protein n=1 Tax=Penicilliopsis zonata CBS 506.65 TaxID=1073090 RepID=A0A1L9SQP7_9EURO|nr:hypothetical protein ASPZODRAFT_14193 [Penicilliopsis zonata CBS 506.65]OJJ49478.1 hypothetical protein ASPZODRAFT_14193 [Penicilliopsis zonata CBS 506.65]